MAKQNPELARTTGEHRTIPKKFTDVSVTAASGTLDLKPFAGQYVWLKALTLDVTIKLGAGNTIANAGEGLVLSASDTSYGEFFIDPTDDMTLNHRAAGAATLRILSD